MAETLISPGVLARENDQSQITSQPIQAGAAIVGPTVKGKVGIPTLVTSYSEYLAAFGSTFSSGSDTYSFLTSISTYNYFQNGGTSLLVTRVASGSFSPATSSEVEGNTGLESGLQVFTTNSFNISGSSAGNYTGISGSNNGDGSGAVFTVVLSNTQSIDTITVTSSGSGYEVGDIITIPNTEFGGLAESGSALTLTLVAGNIQQPDNIFTLETLAEGTIMNSAGVEGSTGALTNGTVDNIRWEITSPNPSRGVFSVVIRRGNDTTKINLY
jgi:hypothetical protein